MAKNEAAKAAKTPKTGKTPAPEVPKAATTDAPAAASTDAPADGVQQDPAVATESAESAARRAWIPHEIVDGEARVVGEADPAVHRLDRAQELPLLPEKMVGRPPREGIEAFKDTDGRTMRVLVAGGQLFKQEV
jgi:hypothetical protein